MGTTVFEMASPKREPLTGPEKGRAHKLYKMMDIDKSGSIDVDEICIVHDSDKDAMIAQLDANGDKQVDKDEWNGYLEAKKAEKGPKRFEFFLKYLEVEIPKHLPEMKLHVEKRKKNPSQKTKAVKKQKAPKKSKEADPFGAFAPAEDGKDLADVLMGRCAFTARGVPVPENVAIQVAPSKAWPSQEAQGFLRGRPSWQPRVLDEQPHPKDVVSGLFWLNVTVGLDHPLVALSMAVPRLVRCVGVIFEPQLEYNVW